MSDDKRKRIMRSATRVFAKRGFYNAKIAEIARDAGVATGTIYLYFNNKDDLLISIFEEEMVPIIDAMKRELAHKKSAREKIMRFVSLHMEMVQNNPDLAQLLEVELRQSHKFLHGYSGTKFKEYLTIIGSAFEEGQASGEFRPDIHPSVFKQLLFGALDQISINWTLSKQKRYSLQQSGEQIVMVILQGIERVAPSR